MRLYKKLGASEMLHAFPLPQVASYITDCNPAAIWSFLGFITKLQMLRFHIEELLKPLPKLAKNNN